MRLGLGVSGGGYGGVRVGRNRRRLAQAQARTCSVLGAAVQGGGRVCGGRRGGVEGWTDGGGPLGPPARAIQVGALAAEFAELPPRAAGRSKKRAKTEHKAAAAAAAGAAGAAGGPEVGRGGVRGRARRRRHRSRRHCCCPPPGVASCCLWGVSSPRTALRNRARCPLSSPTPRHPLAAATAPHQSPPPSADPARPAPPARPSAGAACAAGAAEE